MTELSRAAFAGESLVANMASKGTVVDVMLSCNMIVKLRQHSFGKFENDAHEAWPVVGAKRATALKPGPKIWTRGARNRKFPPNLPPTRICDSLCGCGLCGVAGRGASCWVPGDVVRAVVQQHHRTAESATSIVDRHRVVSSTQ